MSGQSPKSLSLTRIALQYAAIAVAVIACMRVGNWGPMSIEFATSAGLVFYGLTHAAFLYGLLHLSIEGLRCLPRVEWRSFLLLSNLLFTLLLCAILLHLGLLLRFELGLDKQVLSLVAEPGFFITIGIGGLEILALVAAIGCVYGTFLGLGVLAERWGPQRRLSLLVVLVPCLALGATERVVFGLHAHRNPLALTALGQRLPFHGYTRLDRLGELLGIKQLEGRLGDLEPVVAAPVMSATGYRPPPVSETITAAMDFNVLYIMVESLRFDMLAPNIMPHMSALAVDAKSHHGLNHFSTGNSTAESMYGIFSGLSSLHWKSISRAKQAYPVIFEIYERLGYGLNLFYTSLPSFRSMNQYVFPIDRMNTQLFNSKKSSGLRRIWKARPLEQDDIEAVDALLSSLETRGPGKFVDILYLYATHYNYYYQEVDQKYEPAFQRMYGFHSLFAEKNVEKIFNRYRNASYFVDRMAQRVIDKLIELGQLERTIIVFLGDHGEEFLEFGSLGHSTRMNRFQTKVPLIIRSPQPLRTEYRTTSHSDLSPTLLSLLGADLDLTKYFGGKNLIEFEPSRDYAVIVDPLSRKEVTQLGGKNLGAVGRYVLVENDHKLYFDRDAGGVQPLFYTDLDDQPLKQPAGSDPRRRLREIIRAESQVLESGKRSRGAARATSPN